MIDRHDYQRRVEQLLAQIEEGMHDLRLLKVAGVRGAAVAERKLELGRARAELASLVGSAAG